MAAYMKGCLRPHRVLTLSDHMPTSGSVTASTTSATAMAEAASTAFNPRTWL